MIEKAIARTAHNSSTTVVVALNYGAQDELTRATQMLARKVAAGELSPNSIRPEDLAKQLDTADLPPLDLLIRTSGERRLSNFMLWQAAYAELYFTDTLWPDFNGETLAQALRSEEHTSELQSL